MILYDTMQICFIFSIRSTNTKKKKKVKVGLSRHFRLSWIGRMPCYISNAAEVHVLHGNGATRGSVRWWGKTASAARTRRLQTFAWKEDLNKKSITHPWGCTFYPSVCRAADVLSVSSFFLGSACTFSPSILFLGTKWAGTPSTWLRDSFDFSRSFAVMKEHN